MPNPPIKVARPFHEWLTPPNENGCRLFTGYVMKNGYGTTVSILKKHEKMLAHRKAWMLAYGPIPDGLHVLHKCDVRNCCEPTHLFLGTNLDNIKDRIQKGRSVSRPGCMSVKGKFTPEQIREIRAEERLTIAELSRKYNSHWNTIRDIKVRNSYKDQP